MALQNFTVDGSMGHMGQNTVNSLSPDQDLSPQWVDVERLGPAYNVAGILDTGGKSGNITLPGGGSIPPPGAGLPAVVCLAAFFCIIGIIGIIGNMLVIFIIMCDRKMRRSVTNLFIMNLAVSDLLIMLFGVPEIVLFMINSGWLLGETLCKIQRYVLVFSLYSSVVTLVSVCIER